MRRAIGSGLLAGIVAGLIFMGLVDITARRHPKANPATVARIERLGAEVDVLRRQLAETDLARWKIENRIAAIEARVAIVDARTLTLMRVIPVQAIRDRAVQR